MVNLIKTGKMSDPWRSVVPDVLIRSFAAIYHIGVAKGRTQQSHSTYMRQVSLPN